MDLAQVIIKLNSNRLEIKLLQCQLDKLLDENAKLSKQKNNLEVFKLVDYIQIGDEYEPQRYMYLKGTQTGKCTGSSPVFRPGDKFQFIRKNDKSIVIKLTRKITSVNINSQIVKTESKPDYSFRIDLGSLYLNLMKDPTFKESFTKYINRKESLVNLGI